MRETNFKEMARKNLIFEAFTEIPFCHSSDVYRRKKKAGENKLRKSKLRKQEEEEDDESEYKKEREKNS
jgi:hypothetical protein